MLRFEPCGACLACLGLHHRSLSPVASFPHNPGHCHSPVLPAPVSCVSLKHTLQQFLCCWQMHSGHDSPLASSGTVGGSCHCHQPTPTQTPWDSAHCKGKINPKAPRDDSSVQTKLEPCGSCEENSSPFHSSRQLWFSRLGTNPTWLSLSGTWHSFSAGLSFEQQELW